MGQVLRHLGAIDDEEAARLERVLTPEIRNWAGTPTGHLKPSSELVF